MQDIIDFLWNNSTYVLLVLLAIEQLLAQSKTIAANSTFQLLSGLLNKIGAKTPAK